MYENYCKLRDAKGLKDADVARATGITKSTFSDWKSGRSVPKNEKLQKIADFLGVSLDAIVNGEAVSHYYVNKETAEIAQQIFDRKELRGLFDTAKDSKPEDLKVVNDMLLALKRKENPENEGC